MPAYRRAKQPAPAGIRSGICKLEGIAAPAVFLTSDETSFIDITTRYFDDSWHAKGCLRPRKEISTLLPLLAFSNSPISTAHTATLPAIYVSCMKPSGATVSDAE